MRDKYNFSNAIKNPYIPKLKKQYFIIFLKRLRDWSGAKQCFCRAKIPKRKRSHAKPDPSLFSS